MYKADLDLIERNIPTIIRERRQWVCWQYVYRDGKPTKVPINPHTGERASSTAPATWGTFELALALCRDSNDLAGIGYVFTEDDPHAGFDLDGCIVEGRIAPEARQIIQDVSSYTEISPSGRGVKIFVSARKPLYAGCRGDEVNGFDHIEVYDCKRFFVVTGNHVSETPTTIEPRQSEMDELCNRLWPIRSPDLKGRVGKPDVCQTSAKQADMPTRERRCMSYLEKCPDAISGNGGHNATLRAACECFRFGLDDVAAMRVMTWFNGLKTGKDRWSEKELNHKLESARRKIDAAGEWGVRLVDVRGDVARMSTQQVAALLTDVGNAARLVQRFGERIRFAFGPQQWLIWDGRRWKPDVRGEIIKLCKQTALSILDEAKRVEASRQEKFFAWALTSQRRERLSAMAALAEPELGVSADELDADPWLFNCLNGTIDLRTGELRPHHREDLITKIAAVEYEPNAACPRFEQFLDEIFHADKELIAFIQRWHGHCLTGDISEQYLMIYYGEGNNGKNVLLDTINGIMGDWAGEAPPDLVTVRKHPEHPTEIADLMGKRLVIASETERDAQLRLQFIKRITGNARLKARRMRQDFFEFARSHKLILVTNNRPGVREDSEAVWRRLRLVPFSVIVPPERRDSHLIQKLKTEWPGILSWMVRGCLEWQRVGLKEPPAVVEATGNFRGTANGIDGFLQECCTFANDLSSVTADLREAYTDWCSRNQRIPLEGKAFASALKLNGCAPKKIHSQWRWVGIGLDRVDSGHE